MMPRIPTIERKYSYLRLACLTPEQHARTCDYWYILTNNTGPYTAFRTYAALARFFERHKLTLPKVPPHGEHGSFKIEGSVTEIMHGSFESFSAVEGKLTRKLNNGAYRPAKLTQDGVIHYMNPNVEQHEFDYWESQRLVDSGEI